MRYLHTMIRVKDLEASLAFWCDQLGLVETKRSDNEGGKFTLVFLAAPLDEDVAQEYIKIATSDAPAVRKVSMKSTDDMYEEMEEMIEDFDDEIQASDKTIH